MELIRGRYNLRDRHQGCVATVGNFDGVHLGHRSVLNQVKAAAKEHQASTAVIIFEPQPAEFFSSSEPPPRLNSFREKVSLLAQEDIDYVLVLRFNEELASVSAEDFVKGALVDGLGIKQLIIGDDFKFGSHRGGDFFALQGFGKTYGFGVTRTQSLIIDRVRVSSTEIRHRLVTGDFKGAARHLGRSYFVSGRVIHGHHRATEMGFPTANLKLSRLRCALEGIYATRVYGLDDNPLQSITYVGSRPIIEDPTYVIETYIFDYQRDIYGRKIKVEFVEKIRDDYPFESFDKLKVQMGMDCEAAREIFTRLNTVDQTPEF